MNIFTLKDKDEINIGKLNLDDLYEPKRQTDEIKLNLYNKILNRVHTRIKMTSRQKKNENYCWFSIPEIMVGVPKYNSNECTMYILSQLQDNNFKVLYTHPNLLFISWNHYIPSYVRNEFKKKTGIIIDNNGNKVNKEINNDEKRDNLLIKTSNNSKNNYKSIDTYKPSGNFIYNADLFAKVDAKIKK
jgi:hypothetical protein